MPDEQTGLTGHGESGAAQRLPLQRTDGPLTAVLQRRARGAAGTHALSGLRGLTLKLLLMLF